MKYFGLTFSYLKKHFLLPVVAMLIPAIVACFLYTPYWEVSFVAGFDFSPYKTAGQTLAILFGDSWQYAWPVILVAVLQVFGAAIIMSSLDRHFRTGMLSLKSPVRLINISIFPIAIGVIVMSVTAIILRFLLFGLVSLVQVILGAMSAAPGAALAVIAAAAMGLFVLHGLLLLPMLMWAPIMFIYGYKFRDAAALSFKLISRKKLFWSLFLPMLVCAGVQLLVGFLQVHAAIAYAVNFVVFLFTNVYTTVYTMISFYDISGLDRRDIEPYKRALMQMAPAQPAAEEAQNSEEKTTSDAKKTKKQSVKPQTVQKPKKTSGPKAQQKPEKEDGNVL
ncbi:MAG: hypothetical protein K2J01_07160 [Clostridiales bacterium]|nr:hypothetical protein [Clostridiales bacterium]